ncbi:MAG: Gmad2 immunoglobulin-like domain-containing protein [Patescibacteria group bacterium]
MKNIIIVVAIIVLAYVGYQLIGVPSITTLPKGIEAALQGAALDMTDLGGGELVLKDGTAEFSTGADTPNGFVRLAGKNTIVENGEVADVFSIVEANGGGTGTFIYLVHFAYTAVSGTAIEQQKIMLGDRIAVDSVTTEITSPSTYDVLVALKDREGTEPMTAVPQVPMVLQFTRGTNGLELKTLTYGTANDYDMVLVSPLPGTTVPVGEFQVQGAARGMWYFEASFPTEIQTFSGEVIAQSPAEAQGEWMTDELVPFIAKLLPPSTSHGPHLLVLRKDNPSGEPQFDKSHSFIIELP